IAVMISLEKIRDVAVDVARAGGEVSLRHFGRHIDVEFKDDHSPVTMADRNAETAMREVIASAFPSHGILGEEHGATNPDSNVQWILDPIDGTQSFIHGIPLYTTLVGVIVDGSPVAGVIYAPVSNEMCVGVKGMGAALNGDACRVRTCQSLDEATFLTSDVQHFGLYGYDSELAQLLKKVRVHRTWGDAYGHMMVACGRADLMVDPVLNLWDAAALINVVQESGGIFTDLKGNATPGGGNGFSCVKEIHEQVLTLFNPSTD
ncbi:MAG: inositol monophosphatase family protein, partial [Rhodothermaceae bacterium]|nr:inositol monophosphatase family protein [Rhodothermaceae bacterium]